MNTKWLQKISFLKNMEQHSGTIANRRIRNGLVPAAYAALLISWAPLQMAMADSFTNTGSMTVPRGNHTATLLTNGNVLVAGGCDEEFNDRSTAELYDPVTGVWTVTGSMTVAHRDHTATLLPSGKVLVAGGYSAISTCELYDPITGTWSITGSLNTPRFASTSVLLRNGKVLIGGGYNNAPFDYYTSNCELYDPTTGAWTLTGDMVMKHYQHSMVLLNDGRVLVAGNSGSGNDGFTETEVYDPDAGTWTKTGSLTIGRAASGLVVLPDGRALIIGGCGINDVLSGAEVYSPSAGTWSAAGFVTTAREAVAALLLRGGKVLAVGGCTRLGACFPDSDLYDYITGTWTRTGAMESARICHTATLLTNGNVLIAGGYGENGNLVLSSAELYITALQITTNPQSQVGYWGKSVSFSVGIENGTPPLSYQ
jgi:N-acetylneuraminic acid mutarotase